MVLLAHQVHLAFHVGLDLVELRGRARRGRRAGRGASFEQARVEGFVEEDRVAVEELGGPAGRPPAGHPAHGLRVLLQQADRAAPADGVEQVEQALEGGVGVGGLGGGLDDPRISGSKRIRMPGGICW